jgi:hypothetical protein
MKPTYTEKSIEGIHYFAMSKTAAVSQVVLRICELAILHRAHFGDVILDLSDAKDSDIPLLNRAVKKLVATNRKVVTIGKQFQNMPVHTSIQSAVSALKD